MTGRITTASPEFTVKAAMDFAKRGRMEDWVHAFLNGPGQNPELSQGLKLQKRYWLGPVPVPLNKLHRCCGPEPWAEFRDSPDAWERHILCFRDLVRQGWDMPPLIAENCDGRLVVRDGNHRLEAMMREGLGQYAVIIWENENPAGLHCWKKKRENLSDAVFV